jgi:hypothetical protein
VTRNDSAFDIGRATGGKIDQKSDGLPLVKCLFRAERRSKNENQTK